jgi:two-component system response regulator ChvI
MNGQLDRVSRPHAGSNDSASQTERHALRILVVDDDPDFVEAISANLGEMGFQVKSHTDSRSALACLLGGETFDVLLIDWYMPAINGVGLLREIRNAGIETPVIVLSGASGEFEEDVALDFGATDFVDKSRRLSILVKRIRLIADSAGTYDKENAAAEEIVVGELSLRRRSCRALWRGAEVALTLTEFRVVELLAARAGLDQTYREIYDVVHGAGFWAGDGDSGYRVNVRSLIKRIRQKFMSIDPDFQAIENYPGYGYRWRGTEAVAPETAESSFEGAPARFSA